MKHSQRLFSLILALLIAVTALSFVSCDNGKTPADTTVASDTTTASGTSDTTVIPSDSTSDLVLVKDGVANCRVIRGEKKGNTDPAVIGASEIRLLIQSATSISAAPKIDTDWLQRGAVYDHEKVEILVGNTDYSESAEVFKDITYGSYAVKVVGHKLVIAAHSDSAVNAAINKVKELIQANSTEGSCVIPADTYLTGVTDAELDSLPAFTDGTLSSVYECGNDATMLYVTDTSEEAYRDFLTKLSASGYTEYTTHTIENNFFATYTNNDYTINAGYYGYDKSSRVIFEPLATPVGLESENVYETVTTTQLTMFGLQYTTSSGSSHDIGLSMLIRLADGRFIVIDGGSNYDPHANQLLNAIKTQSAGYIKSGKKPVIAAWIITHAHGDHSGMISKQYSKFRGVVEVERFIVNFASETERLKGIGSTQYGENWSDGEGSGWGNVITAATALGAELMQVHVGQVFYLADAKLEILYTVESYAPSVLNAFNTTSLIIKFTFKSGDTFMMTGDATGYAMGIAANMYRTYLKCDMVQVSHHGCTAFENVAGTVGAYAYMAPPTLLWPRGWHGYEDYASRTQNVCLYSPEVKSGGKNANFKEALVSGLVNESVTIPIPYTVGSAIETRVTK